MKKLFILVKTKIYQWLCRSCFGYNHTGRFAICCIAKCENDYIREFLDYHISLGFNKFYLYDNNDTNGECFDIILEDYIKTGLVEISDFRGRTQCQTAAYHDCYLRHSKECEWIAFIDCDEFVTFGFASKTNNIQTFLSQAKFANYQLIHLNWMVYGDNNLLSNDGRGVLERFTCPRLPLDWKKPESSHPYPDNYHIKTIVRGNMREVHWDKACNPHTPFINYHRCCNANAIECNPNSPHNVMNFNKLYLRHYSTKTIGEWISIKMKRGFPDQLKEKSVAKLTIDAFFYTNERTFEKMEYAQQLLNGLNNEN